MLQEYSNLCMVTIYVFFDLVDDLITNLSYSFQGDQQWVMHISSHRHVSPGCRCTREPNPLLTSELVHQCLTEYPLLT